MRFSILLMPEHPVGQILNIMQKADELGYYGFWLVDEIYHKDPWTLMALGAQATRNIRFGPAVTHVYLREPTLIAQSLATLDEISNGRAICALSMGNIIMLDQYHVQWKGKKPLRRIKEAVSIIKTLLGEGKITYQGEFFKYTGLFMVARPKGKVPIYIGAMAGPRSFQMAGEIGDGIMVYSGISPEFWKDVAEKVRDGAEKANRKPEEVDIAAWLICSVAEDSGKAKQAAKTIVGFYIPAMPERPLKMHGIMPEDVMELNKAFYRGDVKKVVELTGMDLVEKLTLAGSPSEISEKIRRNLQQAGVNHVVFCIVDPYIVKIFTGIDIPKLPDFKEQLELLKSKVIAEF